MDTIHRLAEAAVPASPTSEALLLHDHRLRLLAPPDSSARAPVLGRYFASEDAARTARYYDHSALLDALWKMRSAEAMFSALVDRSGCEATRRLLAGLNADRVATSIDDILGLLARRAEAELYQFPELTRPA